MLITSAKVLAIYLKDERQKKDLTQSELGKSIEMRQKTISNFENNPDNTRIDTLFKLLMALDLKLYVEQADTNKSQEWNEEW